MPSCLTVSETGIENFRIFLKFLADNNLIDEAAEYLKEKGHTNVRVSIEVIKDVQEFIQKEFEKRGEVTAAAQAVINSGHTHC